MEVSLRLENLGSIPSIDFLNTVALVELSPNVHLHSLFVLVPGIEWVFIGKVALIETWDAVSIFPAHINNSMESVFVASISPFID